MDYIAKRKQEWDELAALLKRAKSWQGVRGLSADDLWRFDYLYRRASIDLAQVGSRTRDAALRQHLNNLVAAAHSVIYAAPKRPFWRGAGEFLATSLPRVFAAHWRAHLTALLILLSGALLCYVMIERDPTVAHTFDLGKTYGLENFDPRAPGADRDTLAQSLASGRDAPFTQRAWFSVLLFANNLRVALFAMLTGFFFGIPTVLLIFYNGMIFGAFIHLYHSREIYWETWAWLLPHAIPEVLAAVICGGVGLTLAKAVIAPRYQNRLTALREAGRDATISALGAGVIILFAALIESFLRTSELTTAERLTFAVGELLFAIWYFWRGVKEQLPVAG